MEHEKQAGKSPAETTPETPVEGGTYSKDIQPALEPKADERARAGHSGEGDRTDTEEMRKIDE